MKKLILFMTMICAFTFVQAQFRTFTPATNDSLYGAVTKYCTLASAITTPKEITIEFALSLGVANGGDSTHVWIEGSQNNPQWYQLTGLGTPLLNVGTYYSVGTYAYKGRTAGAASWLWVIPKTANLPPYVRIAVQHFVAAKCVKVARATAYFK